MPDKSITTPPLTFGDYFLIAIFTALGLVVVWAGWWAL